jgi:hypothetical protein
MGAGTNDALQGGVGVAPVEAITIFRRWSVTERP